MLGKDWREGTSFVLGDFNKVDEVPDLIERDNARAILIVPVWRKQRWWRRLHAPIYGSSLVPHPANADHCFFGSSFDHLILVMLLEPLPLTAPNAFPVAAPSALTDSDPAAASPALTDSNPALGLKIKLAKPSL